VLPREPGNSTVKAVVRGRDRQQNISLNFQHAHLARNPRPHATSSRKSAAAFSQAWVP
jgi:hypothetical protein